VYSTMQCITIKCEFRGGVLQFYSLCHSVAITGSASVPVFQPETNRGAPGNESDESEPHSLSDDGRCGSEASQGSEDAAADVKAPPASDRSASPGALSAAPAPATGRHTHARAAMSAGVAVPPGQQMCSRCVAVCSKEEMSHRFLTSCDDCDKNYCLLQRRWAVEGRCSRLQTWWKGQSHEEKVDWYVANKKALGTRRCFDSLTSRTCLRGASRSSKMSMMTTSRGWTMKRRLLTAGSPRRR
jgi:hypothetical protein